MNNIPFFILGNPRSGTTLFRLMLNSHPSIVVPPESGFMQWWYNKYGNTTKLDFDNIVFIEKLVKDILSSKKIEEWSLTTNDLIDIIPDNRPKNYAEFCVLVYKLYGISKGKKDFIIGDKNNYYINHLDVLNKIYPQAKYIHLVRDGRDVASSYLNLNKIDSKSVYKPNLPVDIEDIANEWKNNVDAIDSFIKQKSSLKVKYESLITKPEETLRIVTDFLQIDYSHEMLNYYNKDNFDEPNSTIDWKKKTMKKVDSSNLNKYKKVLSIEQINKFNNIAATTLKRNEY